ncbi:chitinase-3-like protein 1 isoform X2 [Eriocheir sinensis]|uniref:chitinase-3-like protein 1 isoform X2 n=1 Tax=Eriocheir sinensis TaxID=95602 RepID=UPI0021C8B0AE|nr:chitinase-3-like protein 1 isoform X2 [Eriocheir sinensis]
MKPFSLLAALASLAVAEGVMVCYYASWAVYRTGDGKFDVEDIDPAICTHLIFAFAGLGPNNDTIKVLDPWNELCGGGGNCAFDRFTGLKRLKGKRKRDLVTLLAVGGWGENSEKYSTMAANPAKRSSFVSSAIALLKNHDFDGLDFDWEYPTKRGGNPEDKANYVLLLSELKNALHANGMMLSAAVSAGKYTIDPAYDVPGMAQHLDLVNVMTYDLHGAWELQTHHHSGLYAHPNDTDGGAMLNQDFAISYWISKGMPANKIAIGVPMYGRCWTLSGSSTGYYAPANQPGAPGPYTNSPGFQGYNEICEAIMNEGWTVAIEPGMKEPYVYSLAHDRIWCSYEDGNSVKIKAQYAAAHGLAGMMVWGIEMDDFLGKCGRVFNLIKTMRETYAGPNIRPPSSRSRANRKKHDQPGARQ